MSVLRQRRRHLIKAGLVGALLMWIPMGVLTVFIYFSMSEELEKQKDADVLEFKEVWCLNKGLGQGDTVKETDITKVKVPLSCVPDMVLEKTMLVGKSIKLNLSRGSILTDDFVYQGEKLTDDLRIHNYNYIELTDKLVGGDIIDVRISFANGADFIVLSKKKILDLSRYNSEENSNNALWLEVTEEELLRLSSAVVDAFLSEGCRIYAIEYASQMQKQAIVTYPVNKTVKQLINEDPNIVKRAENVLEANLREKLDEEQNMENGYHENPRSQRIEEPNQSIETETKEENMEEKVENGSEVEYLD